MHDASSDEDDGAPRVIYRVQTNQGEALTPLHVFTQAEAQRELHIDDDDEELNNDAAAHAFDLAPAAYQEHAMHRNTTVVNAMNVSEKPSRHYRAGMTSIHSHLQLQRLSREQPRPKTRGAGRRNAAPKPIMSNAALMASAHVNSATRESRMLSLDKLVPGVLPTRTPEAARGAKPAAQRNSSLQGQPQQQSTPQTVLQLQRPRVTMQTSVQDERAPHPEFGPRQGDAMPLVRHPAPSASQHSGAETRGYDHFRAAEHASAQLQAQNMSTTPAPHRPAVTPQPRQLLSAHLGLTTPSPSPLAGALHTKPPPKFTMLSALQTPHPTHTLRGAAAHPPRCPEIPESSDALHDISAATPQQVLFRRGGEVAQLDTGGKAVQGAREHFTSTRLDLTAASAPPSTFMNLATLLSSRGGPVTPAAAQPPQQGIAEQRLAHRNLLSSLPTPQSMSPPSKRPRVLKDQLSMRLQVLKAKLERSQQDALSHGVDHLEASEAACLRCTIAAAPLLEGHMAKLWCRLTSGGETVPPRPTPRCGALDNPDKASTTPQTIPSLLLERQGDAVGPSNATSVSPTSAPGSNVPCGVVSGACEEQSGDRIEDDLQHAFVLVDKRAADGARVRCEIGAKFAVYKHWSVVWLPECRSPVILAFVVIPDVATSAFIE